tara:strand:+ start:10936 stop:11349 length:414 start_codon:yes stop_codon:yes gene_type:complete
MRLVVDTNILFSYFWQDSKTCGIFCKQELDIFAPEFALSELGKYREHIMKKAKISLKDFNIILEDLAYVIPTVPLSDYKRELEHAQELTSDDKDVDFVALALKLDAGLWTKDKHLRSQSKIPVFGTEEILQKLTKSI